MPWMLKKHVVSLQTSKHEIKILKDYLTIVILTVDVYGYKEQQHYCTSMIIATPLACSTKFYAYLPLNTWIMEAVLVASVLVSANCFCIW
jgi:hypothetical protein